jgi:hypothetical protein
MSILSDKDTVGLSERDGDASRNLRRITPGVGRRAGCVAVAVATDRAAVSVAATIAAVDDSDRRDGTANTLFAPELISKSLFTTSLSLFAAAMSPILSDKDIVGLSERDGDASRNLRRITPGVGRRAGCVAAVAADRAAVAADRATVSVAAAIEAVDDSDRRDGTAKTSFVPELISKSLFDTSLSFVAAMSPILSDKDIVGLSERDDGDGSPRNLRRILPGVGRFVRVAAFAAANTFIATSSSSLLLFAVAIISLLSSDKVGDGDDSRNLRRIIPGVVRRCGCVAVDTTAAERCTTVDDEELLRASFVNGGGGTL